LRKMAFRKTTQNRGKFFGKQMQQLLVNDAPQRRQQRFLDMSFIQETQSHWPRLWAVPSPGEPLALVFLWPLSRPWFLPWPCPVLPLPWPSPLRFSFRSHHSIRLLCLQLGKSYHIRLFHTSFMSNLDEVRIYVF